MEHDSLGTFVGMVFLIGLILGLMLIAFEDGKPFALYSKLKCKFGVHKNKVGFGNSKINKYYCQSCKTPRKHPQLKAIDGGNKIGNFKF